MPIHEQFLDVSGLEAPEPLLRAIAALEALPPGTFLHFCHRMRPCHLYDWLEQHGFAVETRRGRLFECELFIWRCGEPECEAAARAAAAVLPPWTEE